MSWFSAILRFDFSAPCLFLRFESNFLNSIRSVSVQSPSEGSGSELSQTLNFEPF